AATPPARSRSSTATPRYADAARLRGTEVPPRSVGSANSGSASVVPSWSAADAPSAAVASPAPTPVRRSMPTLTAVAVAPPPGPTRPTAFPLSWEDATGNHAFVLRAIRFSCQMETKLAASARTAGPAQYHDSCDSERHEAKTATRLGSRKYSERPPTTEATA